MSKSYGNTIPLFASREEIVERVMSIVTDSQGERPHNVYALHALIKSEAELETLYTHHAGKYKILKEALVEDLDRFLTPFRDRFLLLKEDPRTIDTILARGREEARRVSEEKMIRVRATIGVS